jgi:hypothetical protein
MGISFLPKLFLLGGNRTVAVARGGTGDARWRGCRDQEPHRTFSAGGLPLRTTVR